MNKSKFIPSKFLAKRDSIIRALTWTVSDLKREIERDTDGELNGEIDVRLCVDGESEFVIRVGAVDFDPYFSDFCAASFVDIDTDVETLADELIGDILDAHGMQDGVE